MKEVEKKIAKEIATRPKLTENVQKEVEHELGMTISYLKTKEDK